MSISLAYNNKSFSNSHPAIQRQAKARARFLSRTARLYRVGTEVSVCGAEGTVVGYNISDFGRWLGISHPVLVELNNGQVTCCKLSDISEPSVSGSHF